MKTRKWYYLLPLIGTVFGLWYVKEAFVDVVYSDYMRLVNSYLPDVWNPDKFFVGDILTRIPLNYLARIINVMFFDYRIRFDQVLGVLSLGASAVFIASYCIKKDISSLWFCCLMTIIFSLNKWEMMINGSGWIHFLAFVGFYYHYLVLEEVWSEKESSSKGKKNHICLLVLPWILTLAVAGPYCASYTVVLLLAYALCAVLKKIQKRTWDKNYIFYGISAFIPLLLYMWSSSLAEPEKLGIAEVPLTAQILDTPGFFVRFLIKSFSSMVVGVESAQAMFSSNLPYLILGLLVIGAYLLALWMQWHYKIYEETIFPLILIWAGGINHLLVMLSRWIFLREDYGMSSRYALQFQTGIIGIVLTFALVWKKIGQRVCTNKDKQQKIRIIWCRGLMIIMIMILLSGNIYTTRDEWKKAPARKEACANRAALALDFENRTDEELRAGFEYHMSRPEGGQEVRNALKILKEHQLNIFRE